MTLDVHNPIYSVIQKAGLNFLSL